MSRPIVVENLGKRFRRLDPHKPQTLQETVLKLFQRTPAEHFWGLRNVSFTVSAGRMTGIIGHNGAGKSTLLRLIGGVGRPEEGTVQTHGQIGALLDLGAGFHPDLTGRENVFVSGVIAGLTRRQVEKRLDSIVEFAELEAFIENPLRTYSSGMQMRLGFAVAAHIEPEILLIDEVLAVGDVVFQQKCLDRIAQFKAEGSTILLVSHDTSSVRQLCDEVIWLRQGRLIAHGPADVVVDQYVAEMTAETKRRTPADRPPVHTPAGIELRVNESRFGSLEMEIVAVRLLDATGLPVTELEAGDSLRIELEYRAAEPIDAPIFGVTISAEDGFICYDTSTAVANLTLPTIQGQGRILLQLDRLDLNGGSYYVDVGVYEREWAYAYDYHWHVYPLHIQRNGGDKGILRPPHHWELTDAPVQKAALPTLKLP
jgi:lipopolysaccharide transport system ATP-binding protein